jgi:hypothetical protein
MKTIYQGNEVRNSTNSEYAIFFEGKELETTKSGSINSSGGIVLEAQLPNGKHIQWRSNDNYGKKGFSFSEFNNKNYASENVKSAMALAKENKITSELRGKLEYKIKK